uniref:Protein kinase domain-containing protein n=1 Tax=Hanusia phi TaxID=3032 RepID=A0A7S0DYP3_9CRYP|mmetsp:Transcript_13085/g.30094  ORF Transcript_13085/g.30094 Transcript_13085/m.30094 type:complete len:582 (+) Transcript_13085:95-1840(+)
MLSPVMGNRVNACAISSLVLLWACWVVFVDLNSNRSSSTGKACNGRECKENASRLVLQQRHQDSLAKLADENKYAGEDKPKREADSPLRSLPDSTRARSVEVEGREARNDPATATAASIQNASTSSEHGDATEFSLKNDPGRLPWFIEEIRKGGFNKLRKLDLTGCLLNELPAEICRLRSLEMLNLGNNSLSDLPQTFENLVSLKILFFLGNQFSVIPAVLGKLTSLEILSFKGNKLIDLGENLPVSLKSLVLTDNLLKSLPSSIGKLTDLQKIMLSNNKLSSLPAELALCKKLELIRLSKNELKAIPKDIFDLPSLAWFAVGSNPMTPPVPSIRVPEQTVDQFEIFERLGKGASGKVYRAMMKETKEEVAIKFFHKFNAISDGSPLDELAISSIVNSSHVQRLLGVIRKPMLAAVTTISRRSSKNLGSPPSFSTITRDTYRDFTMSATNCLKILQQVASGLAAIHSAGVCHGDLYAHNIMADTATGWAQILDFGASFLFEKDAKDPLIDGERVQRFDVLAFGRLILELAGHVENGNEGEGKEILDILKRTAQECLDTTVMSRPSASTIARRLHASPKVSS